MFLVGLQFYSTSFSWILEGYKPSFCPYRKWSPGQILSHVVSCGTLPVTTPHSVLGTNPQTLLELLPWCYNFCLSVSEQHPSMLKAYSRLGAQRPYMDQGSNHGQQQARQASYPCTSLYIPAVYLWFSPCLRITPGSAIRDHSWQALGTRSRSTACKTSALPAVLSLYPCHHHSFISRQ